MKGEGDVSQLRSGDSRHADVDGFSLHMQTVGGDTRRGAAEKLIAPGRPVAANDVDFGFGLPNGDGQIVQQVKNAPVQLNHVAGAMIAQKLVQVIDG